MRNVSRPTYSSREEPFVKKKGYFCEFEHKEKRPTKFCNAGKTELGALLLNEPSLKLDGETTGGGGVCVTPQAQHI